MDPFELRQQVATYLTELGDLFKPWMDTDFGTYEQYVSHMSNRGWLVGFRV